MLLPYTDLKARAEDMLDGETLSDGSFIPMVNFAQKRVEEEADWWFTEKRYTGAIVGDQAEYDYPTGTDKNGLTYDDVDKFLEVATRETATTAKLIYDFADYRNESIYYSGYKYLLRSSEIILKPIPDTAMTGWEFLVDYIRVLPDFVPDYTTGTITVTNGSVDIVGVGPAWHSGMENSYMQIGTDTTWYKIATVTDTLNIILEQTYKGLTAAGTTYILSCASEIPERYHEAILQGACAIYKESQSEYQEAIPYWNNFVERIRLMRKDQSNRVVGQQRRIKPRLRRFIV